MTEVVRLSACRLARRRNNALSRPPLERVTNDPSSRLPFDGYRSSCRAAGAGSSLPKEQLDGCQCPVEPQGAHVTVAGDRFVVTPKGLVPKDPTRRSRSSKKWLRAQRRQ